MPRQREDLSGRRYGRWAVIDNPLPPGRGCTSWNCVCDCGTRRRVERYSLVHGLSRSCGCAKATRAPYPPCLYHHPEHGYAVIVGGAVIGTSPTYDGACVLAGLDATQWRPFAAPRLVRRRIAPKP